MSGNSAKSDKKTADLGANRSIMDFLAKLPSLRTRKPVAATSADRIFGSMQDDPLVDEAAKLGAAWRQEMNRRAEG